MEVKMIDKLIDGKLCHELEEVSRKSGMNMQDLDALFKLSTTIEKLMKIKKLEKEEGDSGYSERGYSRSSYADPYVNTMGNTYANSSYRGYSRADGHDAVMEQLQKMMHDPSLDDDDRRTLQKAMRLF